MYHCGNMLEQPFMRTVSKIENLIVRLGISQITPAPRYESTTTPGLDGFDECCRHCRRIFDDDAAETDVYWRRPVLKE
jgi:hypothetical protein